MPIDRQARPARDRAFLKAFDRWTPGDALPNIYADWMAPGEAALKRRAYAAILRDVRAELREPLDPAEDWDKLVYLVIRRLSNASLYYLFTGDKAAVAPVLEAVKLLETCNRPYWTYSSCLGVLDMDLRTAEIVQGLAMVKSIMGRELDAAAHKRLKKLVVDRVLRPGLKAERNKTYPWMHSRANWRIILCGCFAEGAMAFAEDCPDWRELVDYGIDGVLDCLATGDAEGGWNEGPGYWDYGLQYAVSFARSLRTWTGGAVDLFKLPFFAKTGEFFLLMHTRKNEIWNWSDAGKAIGASLTLVGLARAYGNPLYQWLVQSKGVKTIRQAYVIDPGLKSKAPETGKPVSRFFPGLGIAVWRGGLGWRDSYVGVKGGDIPDFNHHCHMDFGSLVVHAEGRELLGEVDKWPYPYEGKKDPKVKGAQPGYYDIENRRWMRWDFDYVAALGHNMVTVEGLYPQPVLGAEARFLSRESGRGFETAVIDSTAVYRPAARRVRRYIVFMRPDVIVLVDEIRADKPVRARVNFQPGGRVTWGGDAFSIANGPARLEGRMLFPARADHLIMGLDERKTTFLPPSGLLEKSLRVLYVENLCRKPSLVFVTALQFGRKGLRPAVFDLQGRPAEDDSFTVAVTRGGRTDRIRFCLTKGRLDMNE